MHSLNTMQGLQPLVVANGLTALPFPPALSGANVKVWNGPHRTVPEFDIEIWSTASVNLTAAELWAGAPHPGTIADDTFTVVHGTEVVTIATSDLLTTGDGPIRVSSSTTLPAGLAASTDYWWHKLSATTGYFCKSLDDALAGIPVAMSSNGTGTHTLSDTSATKRMHLHSCGLLGTAADGAITLTNRKAYHVTVAHRPNVLMYWVAATLSDTQPVYASIYPRQKA